LDQHGNIIVIDHLNTSFETILHRYGSPHVAYRVANFTLTAMLHLTMHEFSTPEKQEKCGTQVIKFHFF
jgi:hypothetical protein